MLRLAAIGITTPLQLRDACPTMIRQRFNVVLQRTVMELQGTACLDLEEDSPDSKTICTSRSFGRAVEGFDELAEALTVYVSRAAEKMRRQGLATPAVIVMLTTNKHRPEDAQYYATRHVKLTIATADTARLIRAADPRGPVGPARDLQTRIPVQEVRNPPTRLGPGRRRARLAVPAPGRSAPDCPDGRGRPAQRPLWPRPRALRQQRDPARVEAPGGVSVPAIHNAVG